MLESDKVKNLAEIAALEGVDNSYVSRMVNQTTLAPDIVEAILEDSLPQHLTLFDLSVNPPELWEEQWIHSFKQIKEFKNAVDIVLVKYSQLLYKIFFNEIQPHSSQRFVMGHVDLHAGVGFGLSQ